MQSANGGKKRTIQQIPARRSRKVEVEDIPQRSKEDWENAFNAISDWVAITDLKGRILRTNTIAEKFTGVAMSEIVGQSCCKLFHGSEKPILGCPLQKMLHTRQRESAELQVPGSNRWLLVSADPLLDQAGNLAGAVHITRDITERRRAEQLLRKERDRAQKYLDVAGVMLVAIDFEQRVGLINKKGCEILGYKEEEILGKNWFDNFLPESVRDEVRDIFEKIMRGEIHSTEYYENPILTKDGREQLMAWHNTILRDEKGNVIATLSSGEDITEQRKAEKKSLQYQSQLRSVASQLTVAEERERRRIATELHDQIGQSLTISKIRVDALHQSMKTGEHAKVLEEVCNCLSQAIGQVRSLTFDLSSPILHQLGFEAAVAAWLTEQIEAKHHISTTFEDDKQTKPLDDDVRTILFRNVRELLINIVKHAKAHKVRVSVRKIGSQIQVDVQDDGVGFEPAEALAKRVREGKFGLFSVKERLEQIGGHLEIESKPGHGCIVTMTAPLKKGEEINDGRI
jgi:PAS domain S-box-containing protein